MSSIYSGVGEDDLVVGEAVALDLPAASFGSRLVSGAIDYVLMMLLLVGGILLTLSVARNQAMMNVGQVLSLAAAWLALPVTLETLTRGKSVGKMVMGLRTVRDDGGPISFGHALVRAVSGIAELGALFGILALFAALANSKGKRIGDLLAGTYVIRDRATLTLHPPVDCPPTLQAWAESADIAPLPDSLSVALRSLTGRRSQLSPEAWAALITDLARRTREYVAPPPPPETPDELFLAAVSATRRAMDSARLDREAQLRRGLRTRAGWQTVPGARASDRESLTKPPSSPVG